MIAKVLSGALHGVDAFTVELEVDFSRQGLPAFTMVGLAEGAVRESRDRVFSALKSSSFRLPPARITVNLAPADRKKEGTAFDLPLAIGIMQGAGLLPENSAEGFFLAGELSLSGELRPITGALSLAILARDQKAKGFIVPRANAPEAAVVEGLKVYPVSTLNEAAAFLAGEENIAACEPDKAWVEGSAFTSTTLDYLDVKGQEHAKRAVEIATAGGHNLLFLGPPGSGKSMLAQRLPTVLPPLSFEEALEVTKIYSVAGLLPSEQGIVGERPFRAPHHTISEYGLIGGGAWPRPGEISLAHKGVLFLDELLEFRKSTLEVLRQPLETGSVCIARAALTLEFPSDFMLVAAMNPCPCGYLTDSKRSCTCTSQAISRYRSRLSGPLLDRIDLHVEVPAVAYKDLKKGRIGKSSEEMRKTVLEARERQHERYKNSKTKINAGLQGKDLEEYCKVSDESQKFLGLAVERLSLSARAYTRILRISRTIADLEGEKDIRTEHIAEAVNCRCLDREDFFP